MNKVIIHEAHVQGDERSGYRPTCRCGWVGHLGGADPATDAGVDAPPPRRDDRPRTRAQREGATMTDEPKIATTWEECALHVEAGGVVQRLGDLDGKWRDEYLTAIGYRKRTEAPGEYGWFHRRLVPIEAPTPAGMSPGPEVDGRPTWYGTGDDAKEAGMTEARGWTNDRWTHIDNWASAVIVQARYPLPPKPKTERFHWSVADGRTDPNDGEILRVEKVAGWKPLVHFAGGGWTEVSSPDGTVEVLAEDGES